MLLRCVLFQSHVDIPLTVNRWDFHYELRCVFVHVGGSAVEGHFEAGSKEAGRW